MSKMKFGLNCGAMAQVPTLETSKTNKKYLKLIVKFGDKMKMWFGFFPDRAWDDEGNVITDMKDDRLKSEIIAFFETLEHVYKALGVADPARQDREGFSAYVNRMNALAKANYVDIFLQYEPSIKDGNDRTWLEIPRNIKQGEFIVAAKPGEWEEETPAEGGVCWVEKDSGEVHPLFRDDWFINVSKFAKPQGEIKKRKPAPSKAAKAKQVKRHEEKMEETFEPNGENDPLDMDEDDLPF